MSRRDTIIIAVLVNASLLALLFMLAINTDDDRVSVHPEINKTLADNSSKSSVLNMPTTVMLTDANSPDEVDNFLRDLSSEDHSQPIVIDEEGYVELDKESAVIVKTAPSSEAKTNEEGRYVDVTVKRGDALEKIARNNGTTVEAIKKANNLSSVKLSIGQVLKVPVNKKTTPETPVTKPTPPVAVNTPPPAAKPVISSVPAAPKEEKKVVAVAEQQYYTIKSGDNPWKIAKQYSVKFEDLLKLNNLDEEKARNLKVGDKIRVR